MHPKEFKKLKAVWDKKLEKLGTPNIEQEDGNLKRWSTSIYSEKRNGLYYQDNKAYYDSVEEYYRSAGHFLHDYAFKDEMHRLIWEMHAEGKSVREIVPTIRKNGHKAGLAKVYQIVSDLKKIMKEQCK